MLTASGACSHGNCRSFTHSTHMACKNDIANNRAYTLTCTTWEPGRVDGRTGTAWHDSPVCSVNSYTVDGGSKHVCGVTLHGIFGLKSTDETP